jgi:enoyl-CoA hydratase
MSIAREIASNSPAAVFGCKKVIDYSRDHSIQESLDWISMWNASMLSSKELQEGFSSIQRKKDGRFTDLPKIENYNQKNKN